MPDSATVNCLGRSAHAGNCGLININRCAVAEFSLELKHYRKIQDISPEEDARGGQLIALIYVWTGRIAKHLGGGSEATGRNLRCDCFGSLEWQSRNYKRAPIAGLAFPILNYPFLKITHTMHESYYAVVFPGPHHLQFCRSFYWRFTCIDLNSLWGREGTMQICMYCGRTYVGCDA